MRRVGAVAVAAALVAGLALSGCATGERDDVLVFRQFDPPAQTAGLQLAIDRWNQEHPDSQVVMETLSGVGSGQQFAREAHTGSGPDIVQISNVEVQDLAKPTILKPIDELAREHPPEAPLSSYDVMDMATIDGRTWALPWTVDTFALAYRTDLLEQAGAQPPTTWPELASVAAETSGREDDQLRSGFCFAAGSGPTAGQWFAVNYYLWSHDATLIKKGENGWQVGAGVDQIRAAMDYFDGLFSSGATSRSMAAINSITDPQITDGMTRGSCVMTMMAPQTFRKTVEASSDVAVAPMPDGLIDGTTHLGGRMLGINANSDEPEKAWQFIRYLNSVQAFEQIDQFSAAAPVREKIGTPENQQAYMDQIDHAVSFGQYTGAPIAIPTLQRLVNQEFGAVYSGQKDSTEAAEALVSGINSRLVTQ
jgi:multiple sugar transport system substrate-binding protein